MPVCREPPLPRDQRVVVGEALETLALAGREASDDGVEERHGHGSDVPVRSAGRLQRDRLIQIDIPAMAPEVALEADAVDSDRDRRLRPDPRRPGVVPSLYPLPWLPPIDAMKEVMVWATAGREPCPSLSVATVPSLYAPPSLPPIVAVKEVMVWANDGLSPPDRSVGTVPSA